jgi:hypothetical protein
MTAGSNNESSTLTHAAIWALERLAQQRYGRDAPALNWSVEQEPSRGVCIGPGERAGRRVDYTSRPELPACQVGALTQGRPVP